MTQPPPLPYPQPGDRQISAALMHEIIDRLAVLMRMEGNGIAIDMGSAFQLVNEVRLPDVFIARITEAGPATAPGSDSGSGSGSAFTAYGWVEQRPAATASGYEDVPLGRSGTATVDPARPLNDSPVAVGTYVVMFPGWFVARAGTGSGSGSGSGAGPRIESGWRFLAGAGSSASEAGFWARLTKKTFVAFEFINYSWDRVRDDAADPTPVTWLEGPEHGGPGNFPAYEVNDIDVPVSNTGGVGAPPGSGSGANSPTDDLPTVVWMRRGAGDYYLFEYTPRWEIVEKTGAAYLFEGTTYYPGSLLRYDQTDRRWVAVKVVRLLDANGPTP